MKEVEHIYYVRNCLLIYLNAWFITQLLPNEKQELSFYKQDICVLFCQRHRIRLYEASSAMHYASIYFTGKNCFQLTILIFIHINNQEHIFLHSASRKNNTTIRHFAFCR